MKRLFTSESVTEGHPDKICDQISDAVLDAYLAKDPMSRVACETMATTGMIMVFGEITSRGDIDIPDTVREVVRSIGYDNGEKGFDYRTCSVVSALDRQSPDIAQGVDRARDAENGEAYASIGAGDQGMMFGYACDETDTLMPMPIDMAHRLTRRLAEVRKEKKLPFLRPDGKSMVTLVYEDDRPVAVDTVLVSTQHDPDITHDLLKEAVVETIIKPELPADLDCSNVRFLVNPTGRFVVGGPQGDAGLTGRKIIVDTYGGYARHGGGAFSGKDPTKVDRSAAYAARWVAKSIVASGLAKRCEVQLSYAIGVAKPVSISVNSFGTGVRSDELLARLVENSFDLRPGAIIRDLDLLRPIYRKTAAYGHFGRRDVQFPWENVRMLG